MNGRMLFKEWGEFDRETEDLVSNLIDRQGPYATWLMIHDDEEVVGHPGDGLECPIHNFLSHMLGTDWEVRVGLSSAILYNKNVKMTYFVSFPLWVWQHIMKLDELTKSRITKRDAMDALLGREANHG